ncbi:hypothetical protein NDA12_003921 [Ustilago hordei]|nr:hypothetical protein NDA12_003921 [Ustilago hordei]KAJ1592378.1 hypothetical protein NDA15_001190 [Ustilago hordei]
MLAKVELIVNPASGSQLATSLCERDIQPLILSALSSPSQLSIRRTKCAQDAVRMGREIIGDYICNVGSKREYLDLVLVGGDGTTHEILNGFYIAPSPSSDEGDENVVLPRVRLAIVPAGTANALYSAMYPSEWTQEVQQKVAAAKTVDQLSEEVVQIMLSSVRALCNCLKGQEDRSRLHELPLMLNQLRREEDEEGERLSVSHLVTSHALHASILHDADRQEMRDRYGGIERFKVAAQLNATRWIEGSLMLLPLASSTDEGSGAVLQYSPKSKTFEQLKCGKVELQGPFLYLTTMVTDRLESSFIPAPLSCALKGKALPTDAVDVIVIRPTRDPSLNGRDTRKAKLEFAQSRLVAITQAMYSGGSHIDLTYDGRESIIEYLRCSGYSFKPEDKGDQEECKKARLVCTDGFISSASQTQVRRWTASCTYALPEGLGRLHAPLIWC